MGETLSTATGQKDKMEKFIQKLVFVQQMEDEQFGSIEVYRLKEPPYEYIMDYKRTFIQGDVRYVKYIERMKELGRTEHKNLARIHLTELREETHMCIKDKKTHTFCNYYNFNLLEAIKKKKQQQSIFSESQLVYIMGCLLQVAIYLGNFKISIGDYRAKNIFLSPEGYVKLYLLEVDDQNRHSCYYKVLAERDTLEEYILSPQQLFYLSQMAYQPEYDLAKSDLFSISFLVFQLITQDDTRFYYNEAKTSYKFDRIHFDLDAIQKIYSLPFIQLLKNCLAQNPQQRPTLQQSTTLLNAIKNNAPHSTYCIRLHDDEGKKKPISKKHTVETSPKAPFLSNVTGKLMPSPITTLSSSNSSSFRATQTSNIRDIPRSAPNFATLKKSPSLSSKTSQNETQPGLMEKFVQKKVIYFQQ